jgi:hypothetical protein
MGGKQSAESHPKYNCDFCRMYKPNWISSRQGETAEHNVNETYDARSPQNGVQWVELGI